MRPRGSAEAREAVRRLAVARLLDGYEPNEVAEIVGVAPFSVKRWWASYERLGEVGLLPRGHPGRPPKLDARQDAAVRSWVERDAREFGFVTQRWTAPRIADVIRRTFGVAFNHRYLNDWLARRGITPQVPARVPRERDDGLVAWWAGHEWPRIKKKRGRSTPPSRSPTRPGC